MMPAWLLPEAIADRLPSEARAIEEFRRLCLDSSRCYGYEYVIPPILEYADSLLAGSGVELDLNTFKLTDQSSGRTLGLRADMTPQVARIDAHLLNRDGVCRLCYSGSVVHARSQATQSSRELLQFGAELYGYAGIEADIEIISLGLSILRAAGVGSSGEVLHIALSHAGLLNALWDGLVGKTMPERDVSQRLQAMSAALAKKDRDGLQRVLFDTPEPFQQAVQALLELYGPVLGPLNPPGLGQVTASLIVLARQRLPAIPAVTAAVDRLEALAAALYGLGDVQVSIDLADVQAYEYHNGVLFSLYVSGHGRALLRGGRYDGIGEVFGRSRPATGFSIDLRDVVTLTRFAAVEGAPRRSAIRAPWRNTPGLAAMIEVLRAQGETVVQTMPGMVAEQDEFACDRVLVPDGEPAADQWQLLALNNTDTNA